MYNCKNVNLINTHQILLSNSRKKYYKIISVRVCFQYELCGWDQTYGHDQSIYKYALGIIVYCGKTFAAQQVKIFSYRLLYYNDDIHM